ncbi:hypothetical protein EHQ12_18610 [Leptospira gomenensis]|uniref:Uncharacterized protein n=1 Tax=Leptospira gomenensis TaxID=2484974 RepID=A0A5F1YYH0_9LEPT|nr:hypothetical protein [Leptospira gomenensis]TGK32617.1 hypothetical protein EHQ12_18610 [Leptospira gomenensis]TGK38345.1 hypothetical protein EHQ17_01475 [Leptospira gomenensis]TGK52159.1 hypothetical protein EHQ07_00900 [Leptospira gomenensis]TGK62987.1 hypothetical protein EHQ13_08085 [Leptospira gomenensis]
MFSTLKYATFLFLTGCVIVGSKNHFVRGTGLDRASFDFDCPRERIEVVEVGGGVGVIACGKKGAYIYSPSSRAWILNSPSNTSYSQEIK